MAARSPVSDDGRGLKPTWVGQYEKSIALARQ